MKGAAILAFILLWLAVDASKAGDVDLQPLVNFLTSLDKTIHKVLTALNSLCCSTSSHPGPIDCRQILDNGFTESGVYRIWPLNWQNIGSIEVYCDMETDNGGWTVIQRRGNYGQPIDFFYKNWVDYGIGFGRLNQDFWLGNDKIYGITNQGNYTLRIDMKDNEDGKRFAIYQKFWIENEKSGYLLHISDYSGDAGDSFLDLNGMKFSTKDADNDLWENSCSETYKGGWWYSKCHDSNLNGLYHNGSHKSYADGVNWKTWRGWYYSIPVVDMKIRRN